MTRSNVAASHNVLAQCFIEDRPKFYSIDVGLSDDRSRLGFRHTRHVIGDATDPNARTPRLAIAGSGASTLAADRRWIRDLLRLLRAYDRGALAAVQVADAFAAINHKVHASLADGSVGPRCVVVWRNRRGSSHRDGGAQHFYSGRCREQGVPGIPTISNGMDIHALLSLMMDNVLEEIRGLPAGQLPSHDKIHAGIEKLPDQPDEKLR